MKSIKIAPNNNYVFFRGRRIKGDYHLPYQERNRLKYIDNLPVNQKTLINIWGFIHYKRSHSDGVVSKKWKNADLRFQKNHFGCHRTTGRFADNFTASKWL